MPVAAFLRPEREGVVLLEFQLDEQLSQAWVGDEHLVRSSAFMVATAANIFVEPFVPMKI